MKREFVSTMCLLAASLCAQVAAPPKYKVATTTHEDEIVPLLNRLAEQGYRLVVPGPAVILRLEAPASRHYQYDLVPSHWDPDKFFKVLNEQGEQGYRWVQFSPLTEKSPQATKYRYLKAPHGWSGPAKAPALSSAASQGYLPVNVAYFRTLGGGDFELVLEQELQSAKNASVGPFEVVDAMRAENVMKHVDELAKQGYRYVCPHQSNKGGGLALIMQKCTAGCSGPYEYRSFDAKNPAQAEQELNALAKDGFRVVPTALRTRPHLLERDPGGKQAFSYRVFEAKDPAALEKAINSADQEGYQPIGYVGHADWKLSIDFFLLVERPIDRDVTTR